MLLLMPSAATTFIGKIEDGINEDRIDTTMMVVTILMISQLCLFLSIINILLAQPILKCKK